MDLLRNLNRPQYLSQQSSSNVAFSVSSTSQPPAPTCVQPVVDPLYSIISDKMTSHVISISDSGLNSPPVAHLPTTVPVPSLETSMVSNGTVLIRPSLTSQDLLPSVNLTMSNSSLFEAPSPYITQHYGKSVSALPSSSFAHTQPSQLLASIESLPTHHSHPNILNYHPAHTPSQQRRVLHPYVAHPQTNYPQMHTMATDAHYPALSPIHTPMLMQTQRQMQRQRHVPGYSHVHAHAHTQPLHHVPLHASSFGLSHAHTPSLGLSYAHAPPFGLSSVYTFPPTAMHPHAHTQMPCTPMYSQNMHVSAAAARPSGNTQPFQNKHLPSPATHSSQKITTESHELANVLLQSLIEEPQQVLIQTAETSERAGRAFVQSQHMTALPAKMLLDAEDMGHVDVFSGEIDIGGGIYREIALAGKEVFGKNGDVGKPAEDVPIVNEEISGQLLKSGKDVEMTHVTPRKGDVGWIGLEEDGGQDGGQQEKDKKKEKEKKEGDAGRMTKSNGQIERERERNKAEWDEEHVMRHAVEVLAAGGEYEEWMFVALYGESEDETPETLDDSGETAPGQVMIGGEIQESETSRTIDVSGTFADLSVDTPYRQGENVLTTFIPEIGSRLHNRTTVSDDVAPTATPTPPSTSTITAGEKKMTDGAVSNEADASADDFTSRFANILSMANSANRYYNKR